MNSLSAKGIHTPQTEHWTRQVRGTRSNSAKYDALNLINKPGVDKSLEPDGIHQPVWKELKGEIVLANMCRLPLQVVTVPKILVLVTLIPIHTKGVPEGTLGSRNQ